MRVKIINPESEILQPDDFCNFRFQISDFGFLVEDE